LLLLKVFNLNMISEFKDVIRILVLAQVGKSLKGWSILTKSLILEGLKNYPRLVNNLSDLINSKMFVDSARLVNIDKGSNTIRP
jgi:hypothetical protein